MGRLADAVLAWVPILGLRGLEDRAGRAERADRSGRPGRADRRYLREWMGTDLALFVPCSQMVAQACSSTVKGGKGSRVGGMDQAAYSKGQTRDKGQKCSKDLPFDLIKGPTQDRAKGRACGKDWTIDSSDLLPVRGEIVTVGLACKVQVWNGAANTVQRRSMRGCTRVKGATCGKGPTSTRGQLCVTAQTRQAWGLAMACHIVRINVKALACVKDRWVCTTAATPA